jgi:23S rRNA (guanosine2251-2'-O)-methyltransferase
MAFLGKDMRTKRNAKQEHGPSTKRNHLDKRWIWGRHAVESAMANPNRVILKFLVSGGIKLENRWHFKPELVDRKEISALLPSDAVHQGFALLAEPLPHLHIEDIIAQGGNKSNSTVIILDQVTDPQNVGAIIRSAAVFQADAVIIQDRNAPPINGTLAKASSGAIEAVPLVTVTNLSRALEKLKNSGYWCIGLDSEASESLEMVKPSPRQAILLGAEGSGLRRLTREHCDRLCRIDSRGALHSLNVSNAAAIALFALTRQEPEI